MFENRSLKLDLVALALLACCAFLVTALATYDPADQPGTLVYPPRPEYSNACGPIGAYVAHALYAGVGYGAYYLLGSLVTLGVLLLKRREIDQPVLRGVGWAISLAAFATLFSMLFQQSSPGPEVGAGGYLGAMGFALLESKFALVGAFILALSVLLAGLLLCTDYLLLRFAAKTTVVSGAGLMQLGRVGQRVATMGTASRRLSDLEDGIDEEEESDEADAEESAEEEWEEEEAAEGDDEAEEELHSLRVKTPSSKQAAAEEEIGADVMALADGGEDAEEDADESAAAGEKPQGMRAKVASALKITNNRIAKPKPKSEREEVMEQLDAAENQGAGQFDYQLPPLDLLLPSDEVSYEEHEKEVRRKAKILEKTFQNFGFNVKVVEIETGPVIAQFEVELEAGLRLSKITGLADDLAIALRVPSVRIVAPIPGKNTVGIEVPNEHRQLVRIREVIEETDSRAKRMKIPIYLGKDVAGNSMAVDLASLPHLLIAGRTGTGKSVCLNSIIVSMIMSRGPDEVRMLMIDPKMVELSGYRQLPHLMHPVVTDMKKAEAILGWAVEKMEERYAMLARAGVRHVTVYNQLGEEELRERVKPTSELEWENIPRNLPFIVIIADEMADLMMTAGKEVEQHIIRLAQKSRAVGIHLILATQKPTVDVITGLIKSNLPARIAFQVASRTDSRVVLDENGADKLLGNGDMLFLSPGTSQLLRGQGTYLSDDEITKVTEYVATDAPQFARELIDLKSKEEAAAEMPLPGAEMKSRDDLYEAAVDIVVRERRGSVSLLQRCLGIGYGRAARLIDYMAEDGIVGEYNGSQAREVAISVEDWEAMSSANKAEANGEEPAAAAPAAPAAPPIAASAPPKERRKTNKILPGSDEPSDLEDETPPPKSRALRLGRDADEEEEEVDEAEDDSEWQEESESEEDEEYDEEESEEAADDEEWDEEEEGEEAEEGEDELWEEDEEEESEWDDEEEAEEDDDDLEDHGKRAASA
ncbi:DNA translocase FtsK 4TM domain-containing protein [Lacipirellula sp.]|uniref:FtsK/SpoIIIE family DNA translocase n=1 Tax=Lacipirellula sp. TaxID=2691419 RepID=UPI003D0ED129